MKTKHRRAAHAKRKWAADPSSIYRVMNRIQPFTPEELVKLELPIRMAFESLKNGEGTERDWSDLAAAANVTLMRSMDIDPLCEQTASAASDALMRTWDRAQRTGKWGFDGPALSEVEAGIDLHEQIIRLSTPLQMMDAMNKAQLIRAQHGVKT